MDTAQAAINLEAFISPLHTALFRRFTVTLRHNALQESKTMA